MTNLYLLRYPRELTIQNGSFALGTEKLILIDTHAPQALFFTAKRIQAVLKKNFGLPWEIVTGQVIPAQQVGLSLRVGVEKVSNDQGYTLEISENGIVIEAKTDAGIFYGASTLIQILNQQAPENLILPCLTISDYPDFAVRGVMIDVSRDKVPTMETVLALVDKLASWKVNQFQVYIEHTFAYHQHPEVWAKASPFTGEEMMELDAFCRERFIDLVPNQNSFGHMHRWLEHERYAKLAEAPDGWDGWGTHFNYPFSLNPTDPASLELVKSLYDEYLPYFTSNQFNVGCDETLDLGQGKNKEAVEKYGRGKVYLYFLHKIYNEVTERGKIMQFWGDIIIEHPELISELPKDAIALEWGYDASHPFDDHGSKFASAGLKFYVCPGTSSWNSIAGRTQNTIINLINAAENGLKHGASGYLNTDWGDNGHWQALPVSYLGFGMGAAFSWALETNRNADVAQVISLHAFDDLSGNMGKTAYDMGNIYRAVGIEPENGSTLFYTMQASINEAKSKADELVPNALDNTWKAIDEAFAPLKDAHPARPDADLLMREFHLTERMLRHSVMRLRFALGHPGIKSAALYVDMKAIIDEYKSIWLERNRPGGMNDSVARLENVRKDYA
jgi:hexosaminidase